MGSGVSKSERNAELKRKSVVIIGGGYGGAVTAALLKKAGVPFKLINQAEYFHLCVGALRATVNPESWGPRVAISLKETFGEDFIQAKATSVDKDRNLVTLDNGQELEFTHCVVAVGSLGPAPAKSKQTTIDGLLGEYKEIGQQIAKAAKIVVVGGGPVGIELAGEIRDRYPGADITLVSAREKLAADKFSEKFQASMRDILAKMKIKVTVGKAVNLGDLELNVVKEQVVQLSSGDSIEADLVISCIGLPPNKDSISRLMDGKLDENHRIKVDEFLKVEGFSNIYAIGDCCNTPEDKMAAHAENHAKSVAANIVLEASGKPLRAYKTAFDGMMVNVGSKNGAGQVNGFNLPQFAVVMVKAGDLFTKQFWEHFGLTPPKP